MTFKDTLTNSKSSGSVVGQWVRDPTTGAMVPAKNNNISGSGGSNIDRSTDSNTGVIKIYGTDVPTRNFWAYDVQIEKQLPLKSQQTISNDTQSVSTASTESHIILKFKVDVTPTNISLSAFRKKRNEWFYEYEAALVHVSSLMFDSVKQMQFSDITSQIPAGEERAIYDITMIEVTDTEVKAAEAAEAANTQANNTQVVGVDDYVK
ncbi:MAG: hypothetical protein LLG05_09130 [Porphyromonadaceae bacterium]|nr:hypothetical protein [Porphyromonadaceae bacterium]